MLDTPPRILSLLSASTEIVARLGCAHLLVGRSHGCDDPPLVTTLPVNTAPKVDPNADSLELDRQVRVQADSGGPVYHIHDELVIAARPTVIILQEQCRICAVTPEDVDAACKKLAVPAKMVTIMPVTMDDVFGDVVTIANAIGVEERGERLVRMLKHRLSLVREECQPLLKALGRPPPKVAHVEWLAPIMGSGYWIAECVEAAACNMVHGERGGHSPTLRRLSELESADILIISPCGFGVERTHAELQSLQLLDKDDWQALPAVRAGRVYIADGNLYFNRSSCCIVDTAEMVAEMAWPELAGLWGHHGKAWVRLSELDAFCAREGAATVRKRVALAPNGADEPTQKRSKPDCGNAAGPAAARPPRSESAKVAHVQDQVELLRAGDFAGAFAANSMANRTRLGDAPTFEKIVKMNPAFTALADAGHIYHCGEGADGSIDVRVEDEAGVVRFAFDLVALAEGGLATEGVRILC